MVNYDSSLIYVSPLENNRGVFAKQSIFKDTIAETFPIVPLKFRTEYQFDPTIMHYSYVNDACECQECKKHGSIIYFPMGYGGMYNYSSDQNSNITIKIHYDKFYGEVISTKDITKDEELLSKFEESYIYRQIQINSQQTN
jgi:hypothetical protein